LIILARGKHYSLLDPFVSCKEKCKSFPGTIFTMLHFIRNLQIGPLSKSVT
jgi:hypothetical protein